MGIKASTKQLENHYLPKFKSRFPDSDFPTSKEEKTESPDYIFRPESIGIEIVQLFYSSAKEEAIQLSKTSTAVGWAGKKDKLEEEIEKIISEKNRKLDSYRKNCQKCWLLIVAREGVASLFEPVNLIDKIFISGFDRIYYMNLSFGGIEVHRLKIINE
jgi:hypothetical protein